MTIKIQIKDQKNSKSKRFIFALNNIKKSEKISEKNIISLRPKIGIVQNIILK